jgi:ubiquinone/menaquinone biosynthesis C-methylase UbiE
VDHLLAKGLRCISVLDISGAALERAQERLGEGAHRVTWIEADVTGEWSVSPVDIWHDRAVFHFLTDAEDRARYIAHLRQFVKPNGAVIVATFSLEGPERCSGLPVRRYDAAGLAAEFGRAFRLVESVADAHKTPSGTVQAFSYNRLVYEP